MNEFAEEIFQAFKSDYTLASRGSFEKHVAPFLKEPTQEEMDRLAFKDWRSKNSGEYVAPDAWHAALKWERERVDK